MLNRVQLSPLQKTLVAIRRHYAAQSRGRSATPYAPYTGEMPVTPANVGMRGIEIMDLPGLLSAFKTIYTGDPTISHRACNHLESFGGGSHFDEPPDSGNPADDYWGLNGDQGNRALRNAKAWGNFVKTVARANNALGADVLKCQISRPLVGLRHHPTEPYSWTLEELRTYVQLTIKEIDAIPASIHPNPRSLVAGWNWNNDGIGHDAHKDNLELWLSVLEIVHNTQKESGVNWPFYWAETLDIVDPACKTGVCDEGSTPQFWRFTTDQNDPNYPDWVFHVPNLVNRLIKCFPSDATPVYLPYYYPWSTEESWHYTRNAPWRVVTKILEALDAAFPRACHPRLRIEPVLDASEKTDGSGLVGPGHADMHKQIRVINEIRDKLDEGHDDKRFTGFWFMGWNKPSPDADAQCIAEENWLTGRRYAEAIQNEPHGIEGIQAAIPGATNILPNFPNPFYVDPDPDNPLVTRIPYHLAERKAFRIEIYRPDPDMPGKKGKKIRTLDEGYTGKSPQGRYANTHRTGAEIPEPMDLNGTSVHWDGKDEMNDEVPPVSSTESRHDYKAYLIVGESPKDPNEICYGPITMTKTLPP